MTKIAQIRIHTKCHGSGTLFATSTKIIPEARRCLYSLGAGLQLECGLLLEDLAHEERARRRLHVLQGRRHRLHTPTPIVILVWWHGATLCLPSCCLQVRLQSVVELTHSHHETRTCDLHIRGSGGPVFAW
jgi:hypothetical protein